MMIEDSYRARKALAQAEATVKVAAKELERPGLTGELAEYMRLVLEAKTRILRWPEKGWGKHD